MEKHPAGNLDQKVGLGQRFIALLIDAILMGIVGVVIIVPLVFAGAMGGRGGAAAAGLLGQLIGLVLGFGYPIILEAIWGYTIGKKVMGIVVVNEDGSSIGWAESGIRNVLRIIDQLFLYLVGAVVILITDDKQRIGDIAAGTVVVEQA